MPPADPSSLATTATNALSTTAALPWGWLYLQLAALLLPVAVCVGAGAAWTWARKPFPAAFVGNFAMTVAIPALVFHTLSTTTLSQRMLADVLGAALAGLGLAAAVGALLLRLARQPVAAMLPAATFSNAGNLGLPIAGLAFGAEGLAAAVVYFAVASVMQHTVGVAWLVWSERRWPTRTADENASPSAPSASASQPPVLDAGRQAGRWRGWPQGLQRLQSLQWPRLPVGPALTLSACLLALAIRGLELPVPAPVLGSTQLLGSLAVPLMLLGLGHALTSVTRQQVAEGAWLGAIRLATGAVAGWCLVRALGLQPPVAGAVMLQMLMPVAVVNYLYADRLTAYGARTAGAVLFSTALFLLLAPLLLLYTGARL